MLTAWPDEEGQLYSHALYGDSTYGNNEDCEWIIEMSMDDDYIDEEGPRKGSEINPEDSEYQIELKFVSFAIEDESDCSFDYLEVFEV